MLINRHIQLPSIRLSGPGVSVARYESCSRQDCPPDSTDFREAQCSSFNGNNFNIKGLPADVRWVPKYTGSESTTAQVFLCQGQFRIFRLAI